MIKFNKNKLQTFKCTVNVTGAGDNPKIIPRLILSPTGSKSKLFFEGKYDDGKCIIEIETGLDFVKSGDLILEIITNNTVFQPWKDTFEIISERVVVEDIELIDNNNEIIVEVIDTPEKTPKINTQPILKDELFNFNIPAKTKQKIITEYINRIKNIKNKKTRKELLKHIITEYKPKKSILEWGSKVFVNTLNPKAKIAMYMTELENIKFEKKKIAESKAEIKKKYPDIEEWSSNTLGSWITWYVVSEKEWGPNDAKKFQTIAGYNPNIYYFVDFNKSKNIDGTFTYKWKCYSLNN